MLLGTTVTGVIVVSCCLRLCLHRFVELLRGPQILCVHHPRVLNHSTVLVNGTVQIARVRGWSRAIADGAHQLCILAYVREGIVAAKRLKKPIRRKMAILKRSTRDSRGS